MTPFRVILVEPEIPWNTGNVGRTCLALGARLSLVGPLGFSLDQKQVRRSGLDYWEKVAPDVHPDTRAFFDATPDASRFFFFSAGAKRSFWRESVPPGAAFVFGRESDGLPSWIRRKFARRFFGIPMSGPVRSLNLSTAAGIVLAEAVRQQETSHARTRVPQMRQKRHRRQTGEVR